MGRAGGSARISWQGRGACGSGFGEIGRAWVRVCVRKWGNLQDGRPGSTESKGLQGVCNTSYSSPGCLRWLWTRWPVTSSFHAINPRLMDHAPGP